MKKHKITTRSFSFDLRKIIGLICTYNEYIALTILFACGLIGGTAFIVNSQNFRSIFEILLIDDNSFRKNLIRGLFEIFFVLTINFSMGLCLVGAPFICILTVAEGIYISALYSYRIYVNAYDNFFELIICEILFYIILYILYTASQFTSLKMSGELKNYLISRSNPPGYKEYLINYLILFFSAIITVLIKSAINCRI